MNLASTHTRVRSAASNRPVLVQGVVQSALVTAVAFGVHLTPERMAAVMALTASLVAWYTSARSEAPVSVAPEGKGP